MKRINILDVETSNKIAAGEVVERPSSVVKELIENSIDAKAQNITIEIEDGGESLIKIIDDGLGIHPEDIEKAFMPHATSKIREVDDIFNINTLGFRGEALASIASVSKTLLRSRIKDFDLGKEISITGGYIDYIKDIGTNVGTTIEVRDVFFNVPARKKFLKSSAREASLISDIISRISIANPNLSFKLFNNNKKVIHTYGTGNLIDAIRSIYGKNISENLTYFEKHHDIVSVYGYIGNAEISRGSRNNQSIYVNKRYIKNKLVTAAVENAFKSFLTINKFPFFVVFIDIFPEFVDVNIHPTKSEIKFKDDRLIYKIVFDSVHEALRKSLEKDFMLPEELETSAIKEEEKFEVLSYMDNVKENKVNYDEFKLNIKEAVVANFSEKKDEFLKKDIEVKEKEEVCIPIDISSKSQVENRDKEVLEEKKDNSRVAKFPKLNVIGQFNKTYILAEFMDTLYMVDQHAAHEKILFERYRREIRESEVVAQSLLIPLIIDLNVEDYLCYIENKTLFEKAGFIIEEFGDNTVSIRQVPYILGKLDIKNIFISIIDNIKNLGSGKTEEVRYDKIASMACKSAVKANDKLELIEMEKLLDELRFIEDPFNCPHGRPTIIKFNLYELEKRFKRIQ